MPPNENARDTFAQEDHQVAYIFNAAEDDDIRPSKRRKTAKRARLKTEPVSDSPLFVPLFDGQEVDECVRRRQQLFESHWAIVDQRTQDVLRNANNATLEEVKNFVEEAKLDSVDQMPAGFIITGPNIASQDLLFAQLSEELTRDSLNKVVRLQSSEGTNLKATLKRVIRDATAEHTESDQLEVSQLGRKYLDYDLEALHAYVTVNGIQHVFVAFQDSEGFDSGLLSELVLLLHSWRPRIPFTLLFGIATSVELLQSRLLKSACSLIYGAQFDVVQTSTILESVFKRAIAAIDVPLQIGPTVLGGMLARQQDHVVGIQAFLKSLKYAYMCHFYANPLSVLMRETGETEDSLSTGQPERLEALRNLQSFRSHVEVLVKRGDAKSLATAKRFIADDAVLLEVADQAELRRRSWKSDLVHALLVCEAAGALETSFSDAFVEGMSHGLSIEEDSLFIDSVRKMDAGALCEFVQQVIDIQQSAGLPFEFDAPRCNQGKLLHEALSTHLESLRELQVRAQKKGHTLRSKYGGHSKIMRTTVIAQRVQLSQDSAKLKDEDKAFTEIIDDLINVLSAHVKAQPSGAIVLSEIWLYDSVFPMREVIVPRPRNIFERSLSRPHDYLSCSCCKSEGGMQATLPATSILYHLYQETGNLINVGDLWQAFHDLTVEQTNDERKTLVMFYKGMAELRSMGYIKPSRKKTDHVAKVKWL